MIFATLFCMSTSPRPQFYFFLIVTLLPKFLHYIIELNLHIFLTFLIFRVLFISLDVSSIISLLNAFFLVTIRFLTFVPIMPSSFIICPRYEKNVTCYKIFPFTVMFIDAFHVSLLTIIVIFLLILISNPHFAVFLPTSSYRYCIYCSFRLGILCHQHI